MRTIADAVEILQMLLDVINEKTVEKRDYGVMAGIELSIKTLKDRI